MSVISNIKDHHPFAFALYADGTLTDCAPTLVELAEYAQGRNILPRKDVMSVYPIYSSKTGSNYKNMHVVPRNLYALDHDDHTPGAAPQWRLPGTLRLNEMAHYRIATVAMTDRELRARYPGNHANIKISAIESLRAQGVLIDVTGPRYLQAVFATILGQIYPLHLISVIVLDEHTIQYGVAS